MYTLTADAARTIVNDRHRQAAASRRVREAVSTPPRLTASARAHAPRFAWLRLVLRVAH